MPTISLNGTSFEYIEQGRGDPLVLVHGTLGDYRSWELQLDDFAKHYRTISYSRRYHHPNPCRGDESDYSAALHADDLAALLTALGIESAYIVGNSYGAYTALLLAARHPERVRALVLGEPPVFPLLDDHAKGRPIRDDFLADVWEPAGEVLQAGKMKKGIEVFVDGVVEEGAFEKFPPDVQQLILDNACEFKVETASANYWTPFTCEDAGRITTPTLLLTGQQSLPMFQLIVRELERCLPNSERVVVPDSTHEMPADNTAAYNETVLAWLEEQKLARPL
jgi:pimeloyl-ACP methyl ester carboxylesterase